MTLIDEKQYVSRACTITRRYSSVLLSDPAFDAQVDILAYLDRWAMHEGAVRLDASGEIKFFRLTDDETEEDRSLGVQKWRLVARYFFPSAIGK